MGKQLVITEKPSVARDIAAALGGFEDHSDYLESEDYVITFAVGHLLELAEPQEYDKVWRSWSVKNLPIIPEEFKAKPKDGHKKRLDLIKKLGKRKDVDSVINACDAGREGELIFRRISEFTGLDAKPQERLWLQSMTKDAIRKGFDQLRPGGELDNLADSAWLRGVGDWLVGMNATRALTQRLKSRGETGSWSAGRVQTPTLALLVAREREILAHEPRPFWEIEAQFNHELQEWSGKYWNADASNSDDEDAKPTRIFDEERAKAMFAAVQAADKGSASETRKKSTQNPPLPFDLTSLQREANRRYSYSAKRTLETAQRLYEGYKVVTYPRTDSRYLPDDYRETVGELVQSLTGLDEIGPVAERALADGLCNLDKVLDSSKVSDHFAIVPTGTLPETALSENDVRIFDLIVRQFLAALMPPAIWAIVERFVDIDMSGETLRFRTTARSLEVAGFQEALGRTVGSGSDLPALVPGDNKPEGVIVESGEAVLEEKQTKPPPRFTEAMLLRSMETAGELVDDDELSDAMHERGLGTPATRADTIEGLVRKQYARRVDKRLAPTSKAMRLMDVLDRVDVPELASPALTGEWEHALDQVQRGDMPKQELLDRLTSFTRNVTENLKGFEHHEIYANEPSLGTCPGCGKGQVGETAWGYPCSENVDKDSECKFMIWKDRAGRYMDRPTVRKLIAEGHVGPVDGFVDRRGRSLSGHMKLAFDDDKERWVVEIEYGEPTDPAEKVEELEIGVLCKSPDDPEDEIVETNLRYVSRKLLEKETKKGPILPKIVCHREMSKEEALDFFGEKGRTEIFDDFISRRGRPFRGLLFRKPTGKHGFEFPPREKKEPAKKPAAKKRAPAKKTTAKKTTTKKASTAKKTTKTATAAEEAPAKKTAAKKPAAKKTTTKKATTAKKPAAKKASTAKKTTTKKATTAKKTTAKASKAKATATEGADADAS